MEAPAVAALPAPSRSLEAEPESSPSQAPSTTPPSSEEWTFGSLWPPRLTVLPAPAHLQLELEHGLKSGTLKVFVDDSVALERDLSAPIRKKIIFYTLRKQLLRETLDVRPGEHQVRVQISDGEDLWSERIFGLFEGGKTRRLVANFGGIIGKELELVWGASTP